MKISDILFFSPNYRFDEINFDNKEKLIDAFKDRIDGYYLTPARFLNDQKYGFSRGLLCVATIDCLARLEYGKYKGQDQGYKVNPSDYIEWLKQNINEFKKYNFAERFYKEFRCGLVHEGRIKGLGQFSYEFDKLVISNEDVTIINPKLLLLKIENALKKNLKRLDKNSLFYEQFKKVLLADFKKEVERAKQMG